MVVVTVVLSFWKDIHINGRLIVLSSLPCFICILTVLIYVQLRAFSPALWYSRTHPLCADRPLLEQFSIVWNPGNAAGIAICSLAWYCPGVGCNSLYRGHDTKIPLTHETLLADRLISFYSKATVMGQTWVQCDIWIFKGKEFPPFLTSECDTGGLPGKCLCARFGYVKDGAEHCQWNSWRTWIFMWQKCRIKMLFALLCGCMFCQRIRRCRSRNEAHKAMHGSTGQPAENHLQLGGTRSVVWRAVHFHLRHIQSLRCTLGS